MRILCVVSYYKPAYAYGGPVRSTSALCEGLAQLGARVTVLTTNANAGQPLAVPLNQPVCVEGVDVRYHRLRPGLPASFFYSPDLAAAVACSARHCDVALLDTFFTHAMGPAGRACRRAGVPYALSLRGQLLPRRLRYRRLKKAVYLRLAGRAYLDAATALHCTDIEEARAARHLGCRAPAFVVPNGLDLQPFQNLPPRGALRDQLGIPPQDGVLLFLGRLHPLKRPDLAVAALAAAMQGGLPAHLVLAGPDESGLFASLRQQAEQRGVGDRLHYLGLVQGAERLQALADADLMLMPSDSENFGNSAAEALAAGLPVLTSDRVPVGRWAEAAGAGRRAALNPEAFGAVARDMLADRPRLAEMGARGCVLAEREFALPAVAGRMLTVLEALVKTGRPPCEC
jgi:glycosyltransferase involved in cell wall biosynthesis